MKKSQCDFDSVKVYINISCYLYMAVVYMQFGKGKNGPQREILTLQGLT